MSIAEQYIRSTNSSNLRDDDHNHNTDALAAVALSSKLGSLLFRAKYGMEEVSIKPLISVWRIMVVKRAKRKGWDNVSDEVADISLWHWLEDKCTLCHGRGHPVVIDTPTLAAATCPSCNGTGKKQLNCSNDIKSYVQDSIQSLEALTNEACRMASDKL